MKWFSAFCAAAFDVFRLPSANRKLNAQLAEMDTHPAFEDIRKLDTENLKALAAAEWQRSKDLDDKLSKLTAVLSVALTISGVVTKMVADGLSSSLLGTLTMLLMFLAMVFFFVGALVGFGGLRPKPKFGYGGTYLRILAEGGDRADAELKGVASSFQVANAIRANFGSAAIDLIRNGIIAFALGIALSAFAPAPSPAPATPDAGSAPLSPTAPSPPSVEGAAAERTPDTEAMVTPPDLQTLDATPAAPSDLPPASAQPAPVAAPE